MILPRTSCPAITASSASKAAHALEAGASRRVVDRLRASDEITVRVQIVRLLVATLGVKELTIRHPINKVLNLRVRFLNRE